MCSLFLRSCVSYHVIPYSGLVHGNGILEIIIHLLMKAPRFQNVAAKFICKLVFSELSFCDAEW